MKTYSQKTADVVRVWYILDASEITLGRLSTNAANLIIGKGKPTYTPHVDGGDYVVIINAAKLRVSGNKIEDKVYYRHSGYPGGLKERTLRQQMDLDPTKVVKDAIRGMLPTNKLRDGRLDRLKIYSDDQHSHHPQKPKVHSLKKG